MSFGRMTALILCMIFAVAGASAAATWDLSNDWSGSSNPNGAWSYGYTTTVGGPFTLHTLAGTNIWGNVNAVGRVMKSGSTVSLWNAQNADQIDRQAVARWTSPVSGTVHVWTRFSFPDSANKRGKVYVYHNSSELYSQVVMNWVYPVCWDGSITVSAGDTIDVIVGADPASPYPASYAAFDTSVIITNNPTGTVSGTVEADVTSGQAVPYAIVKTTDDKYVTTAGSDGSYSTGLPQGTYSLVASAPYYSQQQVEGVVVAGGGSTDVDFILGGGVISGTVTSESGGVPIAGATVRTLGEGGYSTTTDLVGAYTLKTQPGQFNLLVSAAGFDPMRRPVNVVAGSPVSRNFALRPASTGSQIALPAPLDWGEPPSAPAAPGDSFPVSFTDTSALPSPNAPVIAGWNETVKPDESFTLTGARFTTRTGDEAGTDTTVWIWARTSETGGVLKQAKLWKVSGETILATMPDDIPYGAYLVWVENSEGVSSPILINRIRTTYV